MGLDDFMDIEADSTEETNEEDTETTSELANKENFDEDGNRYGPLGYESLDDYQETVVGEINWKGELYKYRLPIFPQIEIEDKYSESARYRAFKRKQIVTCATKQRMRLCDIPRDVIMLDTGEVDKDMCISVLEDRFNRDITPGSTVFLYFFTQTRHIAKMAIGDSLTDDWSLKNQDKVLKAIYDESYTQQFRKQDDVEDELKNIDYIDPW